MNRLVDYFKECNRIRNLMKLCSGERTWAKYVAVCKELPCPHCHKIHTKLVS